MIYESRSIRVKRIRESGLHTNKETSVKPLFRSYKSGQTILSFVVAVYFFSEFQTLNSRWFFFSEAGTKKKKKKENYWNAAFCYTHLVVQDAKGLCWAPCYCLPFTPISPKFHLQKCCL